MKTELNYVRDEKGELTGVIVPIELWREISSEWETASLFSDPERRERLLAAKAHTGGVSLEDACAKLGISDLLAEAVAAGPLKEGE